MTDHRVVLPVHAREGETVEIHWHTTDGTVHYQRVTCPPRATRDAARTARPDVREEDAR